MKKAERVLIMLKFSAFLSKKVNFLSNIIFKLWLIIDLPDWRASSQKKITFCHFIKKNWPLNHFLLLWWYSCFKLQGKYMTINKISPSFPDGSSLLKRLPPSWMFSFTSGHVDRVPTNMSTIFSLYPRSRLDPHLMRSLYGGNSESRARIFELLRSPRIDSKEPIPPGCVAWRAGTTTLFRLGYYPP